MMKTYSYWLSIAKRYDKIVDYSSPITAWTNEMFEALNRANGDKIAAMKILNKSQNNC